MNFLVLFVVVPLIAAFSNALIWRVSRKLVYGLALLSCAVLFGFSIYCAKLVVATKVISCNLGGWAHPLGISLSADGLSAFMLVVINLVALVTVLYAIRYVSVYTGKWKFFTLLMLMLAGLNGVVITRDIFNLYVFLEVVSISGYALVAFGIEPQDLEASFKYLIMGALASVFILLGIALLYSYTSTLNMPDIASALAVKPRGALIALVSVLFFSGFGLKAAIVPFHAWLADAHSSAPSPVSAILSGVVIKTIGIYAFFRIFFNVLGVNADILNVLLVLGILSMITGALLAMAQNDMKRMFAYSSISQIGYIIFAFGLGTPLAMLGGVFHILNHAVAKSLLFLTAGAIEQGTGRRLLNKLGGLNSRMPICAKSSLIGALSISGVPPFGGFFSKMLIIFAAVESGHVRLAFVAAAVSILTLIYYLKFQTSVFYAPPQESIEVKGVPLSMKVALVILALICCFSGVLLLPGLRPFIAGASGVLSAGKILR